VSAILTFGTEAATVLQSLPQSGQLFPNVVESARIIAPRCLSAA